VQISDNLLHRASCPIVNLDPQVDETEAAMLAIAAAQVDEPWVADWLRNRTHSPASEADPPA
jgi:hypothetical protein